MILSDRTIKDLCIRPEHFFDEYAYESAHLAHRMDYGRRILQSRLPHDYVREFDPKGYMRDACLRFWTPEEIAEWRPMIEPFSPDLIRAFSLRDAEQKRTMAALDADVKLDTQQFPLNKIISRGLTSYGYDVSLAEDFKVFTNIHSGVIDPKRLDPKCLVDVRAQLDEDTGERYVLMPPNSYLLGRTVEYFRVPRDVMIICVGKSTYARSGAIVNTTPIEPGFEGNVVIEISNSTNLPARIYANEGISQFMFFRGDRPCDISYGDRGGKYQGQTGITLPKV